MRVLVVALECLELTEVESSVGCFCEYCGGDRCAMRYVEGD
jgi:hypothetical protein